MNSILCFRKNVGYWSAYSLLFLFAGKFTIVLANFLTHKEKILSLFFHPSRPFTNIMIFNLFSMYVGTFVTMSTVPILLRSDNNVELKICSTLA